MEHPEVAQPIVCLEGITHRFSGVPALKDVTFNLRSGEIHGLVGENGAGKSTLVKILSGLIRPTEGRILLDGAQVHISPETQARYGISIVPQHLEIFPYLSVAENLYLNNLPRRRGLVDYPRLNREAKAWFDRFDLNIDPAAAMESIGFVQQKLVMILKALKENSRIIILDEPTASLYLEEIERLFRFVRELNQRGVTFVYISHHLEEIFQICDRVTVLRDGELQGTFEVQSLDLRALVQAMVGREVGTLAREQRELTGEVVLELRGIRGRSVLQGLDLVLRRGEVLGILSSKGGGKDELVEALFGMGQRGRGEMRINGRPVVRLSPQACLKRGMCLLPEDRHGAGLFLSKPVQQNISVSGLERVAGWAGFLSPSRERRNAEGYIRELSIAARSPGQEVQFLSGGNQQKVVFSKVLHPQPRILVLDSPTVGVDIKSRLEIHQAVRRIAGQGISVLLMTSDLDEILSLSDRILVLVKGRVTHEIRADDPHFNRKDIGFLMEGGTL
jgi:ABC-type sugar transport system ATPase subunit